MRRSLYTVKSILVLALVVFMYGCSHEEQQSEESVKYVKVQKISNVSQTTKIVFNGNIKEKSKVDVSFRVGGPLVQLPVKEGDYVNKGSLIAVVDNRDYKIQLESSEARYDQIKGEYERYQKLFELEKIPANSFEKIKAQYLLTKSGYENAQHQFEDTRLTSPMSGYIFKKFVENYQTVGPGQPVVSIIDKAKLEVIVHVPENQLTSINANKEFFLNINSADLNQVPVSLINIAEKAGDGGLYEVKFSLANSNNLSVYPGMTAEITMYSRKEGNGISIPSNSVFRMDNNTYVWIFDPAQKTIHKSKVKVSSLQSDGHIGIIDGIKDGETVVVAGVHYLKDNEKVQPVQEPSKTNVGGLL